MILTDWQLEESMARRKEAHGGGHGWFVTFADLMGLLVSFFVMLVAFSNQDAKQMQAVAGSMREAFGVQRIARFSGILESNGLPIRAKIRNAAHIDPENASITPTPDARGSSPSHDAAFAMAMASLRQTLQSMPELAEASKHIMVEESGEGLDINIVDQEGSSMFVDGSKEPNRTTAALIRKLAKPLTEIPYRISITGHTATSETMLRSDYGSWNLSADRANTVRQILEQAGYHSENIYKVVGKADTDPLFPEDRSIAANRRVTITLIHEAPPVPPDLLP